MEIPQKELTPSIMHESRTYLTQENFYPPSKITNLLRDDTITSIECPIPNKPLKLKMFGKIVPSNFFLTQPEMQAIIEDFAIELKIPFVDGVFRAVKDDLVISASIENNQVKDFLITKSNPNLIEQELMRKFGYGVR